MLKYPWLREEKGPRYEKRGAYRVEQEEFNFARELAAAGDARPSLEAENMDWADDITYAVHDVTDFFRAGLVPLDRLTSTYDKNERTRFFDGVLARHPKPEESLGHPAKDLFDAFENLIEFIPASEAHLGTRKHRASLRSTTAGLIATFVRAVQLDPTATASGSRITIVPEKRRLEVKMLKELTWQYVILNPALASKQFGQKRIIQDLFTTFYAAGLNPKEHAIFPFAYRELVEDAAEDAKVIVRLVSDMIAGMTEQQAIRIHHKITGVSLGSALDYLGS